MNTRWETIGWHVALMLNKLRNERQAREANAKNDEDRNEEEDADEKNAAGNLALTNRRLARSARVGRPPGGIGGSGRD